MFYDRNLESMRTVPRFFAAACDSISGGSAGCGGSAEVFKNRVLINKNRYLRVRLILKVKKYYVFSFFFDAFFI